MEDEILTAKLPPGIGALSDVHPHRARGDRSEGETCPGCVRPEVPSLRVILGSSCSNTNSGSGVVRGIPKVSLSAEVLSVIVKVESGPDET